MVDDPDDTVIHPVARSKCVVNKKNDFFSDYSIPPALRVELTESRK